MASFVLFLHLKRVTRSYIGAPMTSQNCLDDKNAIKEDIWKNTALYCECRRIHKEEANLTNLYLSSLLRFKMADLTANKAFGQGWTR